MRCAESGDVMISVAISPYSRSACHLLVTNARENEWSNSLINEECHHTALLLIGSRVNLFLTKGHLRR